MRMWGTDLSKMCNAHMLGEHRELHMMVGAIRTIIDGARVRCKNCDWIGPATDVIQIPVGSYSCPKCHEGRLRSAQPMHMHGHLEAKLIDLRLLKSRHDDIVKEMQKRGMVSGFFHDTIITDEDQAQALEYARRVGFTGELDLSENEKTIRERKPERKCQCTY